MNFVLFLQYFIVFRRYRTCCAFAKNMEPDNVHIRHVLLYFFKKGYSAAQTTTDIRGTYGTNALSIRTARKWFKRFKDGDFDVEDRARSGRPITTDMQRIADYVNENPRSTVESIAQGVDIPPSTVFDHLKKIGYVSRYDVWVPHELKATQMVNRVTTCKLLLQRNENEPFLKQLITGDETWILYDNVTRKRSWSLPGSVPQTVAKAGLHPKKVLLSVWWDWKGVVYYELLQPGQTINSDKYGDQLDNLKIAIAEKRPELHNRRGVVFHHDNARPHTSLAVRNKLVEFNWNVLPQPPYSPDIAPSDYHLFLSLKNSLRGRQFNSLLDLKTYLDEFFSSRPPAFYKNAIMSLPDRWRKVVEQNGTYLIQ